MLAERLGPGCPFPDLEAQSGRLPFPPLELEGTVRPVAVRLAPDPQAPALFQADDIVVLDPLRSAYEAFDPDGYYAIDMDGRGCLRHVELRGDLLLVWAGGGDAAPETCISVLDVNILEVVRARAIWIGRHLVRPPIAERPAKATGEEYRRPGQER